MYRKLQLRLTVLFLVLVYQGAIAVCWSLEVPLSDLAQQLAFTVHLEEMLTLTNKFCCVRSFHSVQTSFGRGLPSAL